MGSDSKSLIKDIENLLDYWGKNISRELNRRNSEDKDNPIDLFFDNKAKLQQHLANCEDELKFLDKENNSLKKDCGVYSNRINLRLQYLKEEISQANDYLNVMKKEQ